VYLSVNDPAQALAAFESAQAIAGDTTMKYLAHFEAGRALEQLHRSEAAIREYRRALDVIPDAESATVAIASLQFMRDERAAAVTMIDRVFNRTPLPPDPGRLIGYGSFVRWAELKAALRRAIPATPAGSP
jgi:tetratricopeptide (TPR) repeat protein